ncbi:sulfotransferase domain-containing protein [Chloroflexi bacterium TSY]|nr:sulfotransferase domain-containing protein [Chloroflexi bacterium TSY]
MPVPFRPASRVYQNHHLDSTRWDPYVPRDYDIIISTAYKSGTTWTQSIVRELVVYAMRQAGITDPAHFPEPDNGSSLWPDIRIRGSVDELYAKMEAQQHRRFLKSHLPLDGLSIYTQVKYLIVVRDPRDVFMSLWNHYVSYTEDTYTRFNDTPGRQGDPFPHPPANIHDFWEMWISRGWFDWEQEGYPFWGNMRHTQSWWDYRHLENILFLHYADMKADPFRELGRIANFLDIEITDEALARIVDHTNLNTMRQRFSAAEAESDKPLIWREGAKDFFHQGINGRWQGVLTEAELAMYEQTKSRVLTPECARWLEVGRAARG